VIEQRRVALFFAANMLFAAGLGFHSFLYNFYLEGVGHSPSVMGRAAATWSLGGLIALLPAGRAVDRWGPKPVIIAAAVIAAIALVWGAFVASAGAIYLASALAGAAGYSWRVAQAPVLMDLSTPENRSRLFTLDVALLVLAGAGATALSGTLVERFVATAQLGRGSALTATLVIGAFLTGASALAYSSLKMSEAPSRRAAGVSPSTGAIPRGIVVLLLMTAMWLAAVTLATPFFNVYFAKTFQLAIDRVSWIFSAATLATAILLPFAGEIATRFGARKALALWLIMFAPAMWGMALAPPVGLAAVCYLLQSFVSPAANPLIDQLLLENVPTERRGAVMSWRQAMASGGQVMAQATGGVVLGATSFAALFAFAGSLGLVAGAAVALAAWRLGKR
jgi:MFS family permease